MNNSNNLMTIQEVANYLKLKKKNIYSKVEKKEIPFYRIGKLIRFKKDDVDHWLESCRSNKEVEERKHKTKTNRKYSSFIHNNHIDKITRKIIDGETTKYYHNNHGKSDLIKAQEKGE